MNQQIEFQFDPRLGLGTTCPKVCVSVTQHDMTSVLTHVGALPGRIHLIDEHKDKDKDKEEEDTSVSRQRVPVGVIIVKHEGVCVHKHMQTD